MSSLTNLLHDLPHNFEAEQALLGSILMANTAHLRFDGPTTSLAMLLSAKPNGADLCKHRTHASPSVDCIASCGRIARPT